MKTFYTSCSQRWFNIFICFVLSAHSYDCFDTDINCHSLHIVDVSLSHFMHVSLYHVTHPFRMQQPAVAARKQHKMNGPTTIVQGMNRPWHEMSRDGMNTPLQGTNTSPLYEYFLMCFY